VKFIEENKNRPFCLYVAHEAVHSPFQGPNSQIGRGPKKGTRENADDLSEEEAYVQMMQEMDKGLGEIMATIKRLGLSEDTFVFFFSDNGHAYAGGPESYKCPLRGKKGSEWEGGHRIPAIASWPGRIEPGVVNDDLYISLDLMPTMLELAGVIAPAGHKFDGVSMAGALEMDPLRDEEAGKRRLFWNGKAMRDGVWKLVLGQKDLEGIGLYNLDEDLGEENNLADEYPERVKEMTAAIKAWEMDVAHGATKQPEPPEGSAITTGRKRKGSRGKK